MKKLLLLIFGVCLTATSVFAQNFADSLRAFPGAEGYGAWVTGGRGGRVVYVTHTEDVDNPADPNHKNDPKYQGSFRQAIKTPGNDPIIIMFKCGGVIHLKNTPDGQIGNVKCGRSNVTIAGQTALGDGICIKGVGVGFSGRNIIIRHMRFRPGDINGTKQSCLWFENGGDFIIDHCSFSWAVEESMTVYDNDHSTVQNSLVSESLTVSIHDKGSRGYGAQWGGATASYHHNMLAHHNSRMPRQNGARGATDAVTMFDYRNNVHYNWGSDGAFYGGDVEPSRGGISVSCNIMNNYYIPGPSTTTTKTAQYFVAPTGGAGKDYSKWYLSGNFMWDNPDKTNNQVKGISNNTGYYASTEFAIPTQYSIAPMTAEKTLDTVFTGVGATLPKRDAIDIRIIDEVRGKMAGEPGYTFRGSLTTNTSKSYGLIDTQEDTKPAGADASWNAWGSYYAQVDSTQAPLDSDGDGMPDWWEIQFGLDPSNPADGKFRDYNNYTYLENYLNREDLKDEIYKQRQTISWDQDTVGIYGDPNIVLTATASSGLPVQYASKDTTVLRVVNGNELEILWIDKVTITATQAGNDEYVNAWPVSKTFAVLAFRPEPDPEDPSTGVDYKSQLPVKAYPNPVKDLLYLNFEEDGLYEVKLVSLTGMVVYCSSVSGGSHLIDVSSYPSGIYLLSIENAQHKRAVQKVEIK